MKALGTKKQDGNQRQQPNGIVLCGKQAVMLLLLLLPFIGFAQSFFTTPKMTFIESTTEIIKDLAYKGSTTSLSAVQKGIDSARLANPSAIIRITLYGNFTVTSAPIQLSSKMLLLLTSATLQADVNATATALISVATGSSEVSIGVTDTCVLDGNNVYGLAGIVVTASGKTHIDKLTIKNCPSGGVGYTGKGITTYGDAGSVTRCRIENCTNYGIQFTDAFNFVCTDNTIKSCNVGLSATADNASIANNTISGCLTGIAVTGTYDVVTYNTVTTCQTGIALYNPTTTFSEAVVTYNTVKSNTTTGFYLDCTKARIYYNDCANNNEFTTGSKVSSANVNHLFANKGVTDAEGNKTGCLYFNPPTIGNPHSDVIKIGKARYDTTITGGTLKSVRTALTAARAKYPSNTVIVAHLNGNFSATTNANDSLLVNEDECILLNGTIKSNDTTNTVVLFSASNSVASFSGGTINGNGTNGQSALIYVTGSAIAVLDSITVKNSVGQGIAKRSSSNPTYIRACYVDSSFQRGVWQLASSSRLIAVNNTVNKSGIGAIGTSGTYDGFDLDAYSATAVLIKNTVTNSTRYGVFIEEGALNHVVLANTLTANNRGVSFYNLGVPNKNTSRNLVANNICRLNQRGVHVDASALDKATIDNVIFNNICENNTDVGFGGLYSSTTTSNNYIAFNTIQNNAKGVFATGADLVANNVWNSIASSIVLPILLHSFEGSLSSNGILLQWSVQSAINAHRFEVQRSANAKDFIAIGSLPVQANTTIKNDAFEDENPLSGINYYRLKLVDADGSFSFSNTIAIKNAASNPASIACWQINKNALRLNITTTEIANSFKVELYDLLGQKIYNNTFKGNGSNRLEALLPLGAIRPSTYVLKAETAHGHYTKKIIITQ